MKRNTSLFMIGLMGTIMVGSSFFMDVGRSLRKDPGIWWTHIDRKLPLEKSENHFELYIAGKRLQQHLSDGTLLGIDPYGNIYRIMPADVAVRLNNWDNVKAGRMKRTMLSGPLFGVFFTLLILGMLPFFRTAEEFPTKKKRP